MPRRQRLQARITPACAGKSEAATVARPAVRDHPRVCGEKCENKGIKTLSAGSPPRVRGKVLRLTGANLRHRITPACAGKR